MFYFKNDGEIFVFYEKYNVVGSVSDHIFEVESTSLFEVENTNEILSKLFYMEYSQCISQKKFIASIPNYNEKT